MNEEMVESSATDVAINSKAGKRAKNDDAAGKLKLVLNVGADHWLNRFQDQCKVRGIKNIEISDVLLEALAQVPDHFWENKIEELTPLEYRINAALSDPNMREKLQELLASQAAKSNLQ